jgi:hypothetical protein
VVDVDALSGGDPKAMAAGFRPGPRVALSDGGVYDNMGLEPAWKTHGRPGVQTGERRSRSRREPGPGSFLRLQRSFQVVANQASRSGSGG